MIKTSGTTQKLKQPKAMFIVLRRQIKLGTRMRPKCSPIHSEQMAAQVATGNSAQVFKVTEKMINVATSLK